MRLFLGDWSYQATGPEHDGVVQGAETAGEGNEGDGLWIDYSQHPTPYGGTYPTSLQIVSTAADRLIAFFPAMLIEGPGLVQLIGSSIDPKFCPLAVIVQ